MGRPRGKRKSHQIGAEIIATLMHAPRTRPDLAEQVGMNWQTESAWFEEMRTSGVLRVRGFQPRIDGKGAPTAVYELQRPFAQPDAPFPQPCPDDQA